MQKTILVADDDDALMQRICSALEEQNYRVCLAHNSDDAIDQALTNPVDLLILGQNLPGAGELAVLEILRKTPQTIDLPIIFLAANLEDEEVYFAWHNKVDSFQSKRESGLPHLTPELVVKIKRIFKSQEEDKLLQSG